MNAQVIAFIGVIVGLLTLVFAWRGAHWAKRAAVAQEKAILPQVGKALKLDFHPDHHVAITLAPGDELPLTLRNLGDTRLKGVRVGVFAKKGLLNPSTAWKEVVHPIHGAGKGATETFEQSRECRIDSGGELQLGGLRITSGTAGTGYGLQWHVWIGKELVISRQSLQLTVLEPPPSR